MATTNHQSVFTPNTGSIAIYVWQEGQNASDWQVAFQYTADGDYWQMWLERKDGSDETSIANFDNLLDAVSAFVVHPEAFPLPAELVAEVRA